MLKRASDSQAYIIIYNSVYNKSLTFLLLKQTFYLKYPPPHNSNVVGFWWYKAIMPNKFNQSIL